MELFIGSDGAGALEAGPNLILGKAAIVRVLDKMTGMAQTLTIPVGGGQNLDRLTLSIHTCNARDSVSEPDAGVFLQIDDTRPGQTAARVFSGWMFASSPSLSAMDHPRYDVWLISCKID